MFAACSSALAANRFFMAREVHEVHWDAAPYWNLKVNAGDVKEPYAGKFSDRSAGFRGLAVTVRLQAGPLTSSVPVSLHRRRDMPGATRCSCSHSAWDECGHRQLQGGTANTGHCETCGKTAIVLVAGGGASAGLTTWQR